MNKIEQRAKLVEQIEQVTEAKFKDSALAVFRYQAEFNPLYREFIKLLGVLPAEVQDIQGIPFLPISFFKYHTIQTGNWAAVCTFTSSGTTQQAFRSRHLVRSLDWYNQNAFRCFESHYGSIENYVVLALLPSYLEREGSSLVFMAERFIEASKYAESGFFLHNQEALVATLKECMTQDKPVLLLGVTYALLDLADAFPMPLKSTVLMETGGMKGTRKEMPKSAIHAQLKQAFGLDEIHSEYGMTELLSQAYSLGAGRFEPSPTLQVYIRETTDPLTLLPDTKAGAVNLIDLANIDTCSFIATDDLGRRFSDGSFELLGRMDASDLRGCNLLVAEQ